MTSTQTRADIVAELTAAVDGEVDANSRRRAEYSTDASNYRIVPQVVVFPRDADDLVAALATARTIGVPTTMRGGGTSTAGNSIGAGVVIDTSRHMNRILDVDLEAKTARVQPGVILTDLQKRVGPAGMRFGPDPSTSSRATLGGMIGNNACGPHAVAYGKTSENVSSLNVVDGAGRRYEAADSLGAVPGLDELVAAHLSMIRTEFGRFGRQVSGYSLEHLLPENGHSLARFLVGTEGTLATTVEATVKLVDVAPVRLMAAFGYDDMPAAADAVVPILAHSPDAVEGLDARLVARVRRAHGAGAIPELPPGAGWLFVEIGAQSAAEAEARMAVLAADAGTASVRIVRDPLEAARLWAIRADGAGLAGRTQANMEAWPGWEDAAVPPARLGEYLRALDVLMERHGVSGEPFGHFGDGCVHMRIDIPLHEDGRPLRAFMEDGAALVTSLGGSLSGEHGDGRARSELLKVMYSAEAIDVFGKVKAIFDPEGNLNPGVIVDPAPLDADLRRPAAKKTPPSAGGFAFAHDHGDLTEAVHRCTGVGKCRSDAVTTGTGFMCPSFAATGDEKDVTRGRARVLQEAINGTLVGGLKAPEVRESLDLCLSCKACSSDCPSGVDMAAYKSEVLYRTYKNKVRPVAHYTVGWLPRWLHVASVAPRLANAVMSIPGMQKFATGVAGMDTRRKVPTFATTAFRKTDAARARATARVGASRTENRVVLWVDSFTDGMDPQIPMAIIAVLEDAGLDVVLADGDACCGVTWISTGQLDGARKRLTTLLGTLGPYAVNGIPIVGVEPSCMAALRGDLTELLPDDPRAGAVAQGVFSLAEVLTGRAPVKPREGWQPPRLDDVNAVVQPHCHQYSVMGYTADRDLLARAGATVTEASGCCGLAGNWGAERGHYETSMKVAHNSLVPALEAAPAGSIFLADGVSCRTQGVDAAGIEGRHLAQLLADRI